MYWRINYEPAYGEATYSYYGQFIVDINGPKGPNRGGYDLFLFSFKDKGINLLANNSPDNCDSQKGYNNSLWDGASCSTWIIRHGNVDYKYRNVSADW